ncbi:MAG: YceD family protein [Candidatus Coproplasma sp.]
MVMVLDIKKLIAKKQYVGTFAFDCAPPKDKLVLPLTEVEGDLKAEGEYEIYEDDCVGVTLKLSYKLKGQCSYCLENAEEDITFVTDVLFVPDKDDADNYYYDGARLDLSVAVSDAFVFSQPKVLLCKACRGE